MDLLVDAGSPTARERRSDVGGLDKVVAYFGVRH
jgi:hypothetical protein